MIVGFTGTQKGMSHAQALSVERTLLLLDVTRNSNPKECGPVTEIHHGDCEGSDAQFHNLVRKFLPNAQIVVHPPSDSKKRAFMDGDIVLEPKPYLDRNCDIVNSVDILMSTPSHGYPLRRSGTWHTIRYAVKKKMVCEVFGPDGGYIPYKTKEMY